MPLPPKSKCKRHETPPRWGWDLYKCTCPAEPVSKRVTLGKNVDGWPVGEVDLPAQEEEKLKHGARLFITEYGETMKRLAEDDAQEEKEWWMKKEFWMEEPYESSSRLWPNFEAIISHASKLAREELKAEMRHELETMAYHKVDPTTFEIAYNMAMKNIQNRLSSLTPDI